MVFQFHHKSRAIVNTLTADERAQMIEATKSVWDKYLERAGEIGQKLVAIAKDPKTFQ